MGHDCWTSMSIGGPIIDSDIDELIETINDEFHDKVEHIDRKLVAEAIAGGYALDVSGNVRGDPDETAALCQARGLTYHYVFEAGPEWGAGIRVWNPEVGRERDCDSVSDDEPAISLRDIEQAANDGKTLHDIGQELAAFRNARVPALTLANPELPLEAA